MRRRDSTGRASGLARATRSGMDGPGTWRAGALTADRCGCRGPQRRAKLDFPHLVRSGGHSLWWDLSVRRDYAGVGPVMGHRKNPPASMRGSDAWDESKRIDPRRRQRSSVIEPRTGSSGRGRWRVAHVALAVRFANMVQAHQWRQCGVAESRRGRVPFQQPGMHMASAALSGSPHYLRDGPWRIAERPPPARWVGTRAPPHDKIAESRAKAARGPKRISRSDALTSWRHGAPPGA